MFLDDHLINQVSHCGTRLTIKNPTHAGKSNSLKVELLTRPSSVHLPNNRSSCRKPGMGYTIACTLCAEGNILAQYEGETGRCLNTRGLEHIDAFQTGKKSNCLVIHNAAHHSLS